LITLSRLPARRFVALPVEYRPIEIGAAAILSVVVAKR
jgi:hypothetical protein